MANRKVLINRHTTGNTAPTASEMYLGEIAVAHKTGEEIIWTKNNAGEMVPFISCAQTKTMVDNSYNVLSGAIDEVLSIITTSITGDSIISVQPETSGAGAYSLTHKSGAEASGFKKLSTDTYGHVTAATDVVAADIKALGFEDSAWTEEKIASAITALDSSVSASTGKYFTALAIENGLLVAKEEADIPTLEVESAGTGNVVSQITVADHKITYQTVSVATSEDIQALSGAVIAFSAETVAEFSSAFTAINNLSADTDTAIAQLSAGTIQLSADTKAAIAALSAGTVHDVQELSGVVIDKDFVIAQALNDLNNKADALSGDVISLSAATVGIETGLGNLSAVTLTGVSLNNEPLTVSNHIVTIPVTTSGSGIANATDSGSVADAKAVKEYVENVVSSSVDYKGATASTPASAVKGDLYIASADFMIGSDKVETGDFIIYNGSSWDIIEKNLDGAITGSLTQDTVVLGDSTNSVKSLTNGTAGQVLTMDNGAPTWADLPELASATTGTGNVVTDIAVSDHTITFTKGLEAAADSDLKALSAGTIQLSGDVVAYVNALSADVHNSMIARDDAVFSSAVTYVGEEIDEVYASAVSYTNLAIADLDSTGNVSTTGNYLTSVTITDGKITAVGEETLPAATPVTTVAGTTGNTASAVLTGITTGGTDGHQLTLNASNKIFSAETSDSAITSVSAQTSVSAVSSVSAVTSESADTADKVANALSFSGYSVSSASTLDTAISYDGSAAQSLTFGTNGNAGLKSMSMTSAGVVDVEVIDCGEY